MTDIAVMGLGIRGPGLEDWERSAPILRGDVPYRRDETHVVPPPLLSARERRRASQGVKLALEVAAGATTESGFEFGTLQTLFAACHGESITTHKLLDALSTPDQIVSPTQFHNSVHNTAAGYWSISTGSRAPCDSIAAGDFTVGAALLKAVSFVASEGQPLLTVFYDTPFPGPLDALCALGDPFGAAMVLAPADTGGAICRLHTITGKREPDRETCPAARALRELFRRNPAARILPLLEAIAGGRRRTVEIPHAREQALFIDVTPC